MKEKWLGVPGYYYEVSDKGRVRNVNNGKLLKPAWVRGKNIYRYRVYFGGRNWMLHILCYKVFNKKPLFDRIVVSFIDGNSKNVDINNLAGGCLKNLTRLTSITGEMWKEISIAPGYFVSDHSRIAREINGVRFLVNTKIYYNRDNKFVAFNVSRAIHKNTWLSVKLVVSMAFCGNKFKLSHVKHVDGDIHNCFPSNLKVIKKSYTVVESIAMISSSPFSNSDGGVAAVLLMRENDDTCMIEYIKSNYKFLIDAARLAAYKMGLLLTDGDDGVHDMLIEIKNIVRRGNYTGKTRLKYFMLGVVKNMLRKIRHKLSNTTSCYNTNQMGEIFFKPDEYQSHTMPDGSVWSAHT